LGLQMEETREAKNVAFCIAQNPSHV